MASGVIVADNDVVIRGILRSMLASVGQRVFVAASGWEAIGLASQAEAELVLLDLDMPGLNGLLTCKKLRALPGYATTPIVILSAFEGERAREAASRVGATQFVAKPFQPASLLNTLSAFLNIDATARGAVSLPADGVRQRMTTAEGGRAKNALDQYRI